MVKNWVAATLLSVPAIALADGPISCERFVEMAKKVMSARQSGKSPAEVLKVAGEESEISKELVRAAFTTELYQHQEDKELVTEGFGIGASEVCSEARGGKG